MIDEILSPDLKGARMYICSGADFGVVSELDFVKLEKIDGTDGYLTQHLTIDQRQEVLETLRKLWARYQ